MLIRDLLIFTVIVVLSCAHIRAADGTAPAGDKPAENPPKVPSTEDKSKEKSLLEQVTDQLWPGSGEQAESDSTKSDPTAEKMDRAVKGMRSAGGKLDEGLTSDETQRVQKQVIKDLEDIINQLENPPPPDQNNQNNSGGGGGGGGSSSRSRSNSGGGGGGSRQKQRRPMGSSARGSSGGQQQQKQGQQDQQGGGDKSENPSDSSKSIQARRQAAEEAARKKKLSMDIWGHLPPHLREELLSTYGEHMLPKYEQMVKQFYEALSTTGDPKQK